MNSIKNSNNLDFGLEFLQLYINVQHSYCLKSSVISAQIKQKTCGKNVFYGQSYFTEKCKL